MQVQGSQKVYTGVWQVSSQPERLQRFARSSICGADRAVIAGSCIYGKERGRARHVSGQLDKLRTYRAQLGGEISDIRAADQVRVCFCELFPLKLTLQLLFMNFAEKPCFYADTLPMSSEIGVAMVR